MKGSTTLRVDGMHCPACAALIEREFSKVAGTVSAVASLDTGTAKIEWEGTAAPDPAAYRSRAEAFGYRVPENAKSGARSAAGSSRISTAELRSWAASILLAAFFVAAYYGLQASGLTNEASSRSEAIIAAAFLSGLAASVSSCLALVGSLVLALGAYADDGADRFAPLKRNSLFQAGRVGGFILLGGLLGFAGGGLSLSGKGAAVATILGGALALILGLGLLFPKTFGSVSIRLPRSFSRFLDSIAASGNPLAPILLGSASFFLPCGFALSMQALALASGSFRAGAMIMGAFAIGTAPVLTAAGLAGSWTKRRGPILSRAAALTIVAFSLFAVAAGFSLFGFGGSKGLKTAAGPVSRGGQTAAPTPGSVTDGPSAPASQTATAPGAAEIQRVTMKVGANAFEPAEIRVKTGVPVEWIIYGENPSGCTNRIVVPSADLSVPVRRGESQTVRFTASEKGVVPFSCWMGMVRGKIVID